MIVYTGKTFSSAPNPTVQNRTSIAAFHRTFAYMTNIIICAVLPFILLSCSISCFGCSPSCFTPLLEDFRMYAVPFSSTSAFPYFFCGGGDGPTMFSGLTHCSYCCSVR